MGTRSDQLQVNGDLYAKTNARVEINGNYRFGIRSINFSEDVAKKHEYGTGRTAVGKSTGEYKATVSIEVLKHEADLIIYDLAMIAKGIGGNAKYTDIEFSVTANFKPIGIGTTLGLSSVEIKDAVIMKCEEGFSSDEAIVTKMELLVVRPIRKIINGELVMMSEDPVDGSGGVFTSVAAIFGF